MSLSQQSDLPQVLTASTHDLRYFTTLLRGISFANRATVALNEAGFVISVEEARSLQGIAFVEKWIFDEFVYIPPETEEDQDRERDGESSTAPSQTSPPHIEFEIQLNTLLECLNVFGTAGAAPTNPAIEKRKQRGWKSGGHDSDPENENGHSGRSGRSSKTHSGGNSRIDHYIGKEKGTALRLSYAGTGHPLTLLIAEDAAGPTATCEITTFTEESALELPFDGEIVMDIILKSSWLLEALSELHPSCENLTIIGNPPPPAGKAPNASSPPRLRLKTSGTFGTTEMDYPFDKEVLEQCNCDSRISYTYKAAHLIKTVRALQHSVKTSLRINEQGVLNIQVMMAAGRKGKHGFVEFRLLPLDESSQAY